MFKNRFLVIFINYDDIKQAISTKIQKERKSGYTGQITFYASNYTDLRATEHLTHFHQEFIPFFEQFENVVMETRTKAIPVIASNAKQSSNTELAFSLSPTSIAKIHEPGTASLSQKLQTINQLLNQGYRIGLRFLPLIPVENYVAIYQELIDQVKSSLNINKISSIAIAPLIESKEERNSDFLSIFEKLFHENFPNSNLFRDYQ